MSYKDSPNAISSLESADGLSPSDLLATRKIIPFGPVAARASRFPLRGKDLERDERHLWPVFYELIRACRPPLVFGEQVSNAKVVGEAGKRPKAPVVPVWFDGVFSDLERAHYACGAVDIPAAGICAPHIRQRLYWVAHTTEQRLSGVYPQLHQHPGQAQSHGSKAGTLAHSESGRLPINGSTSWSAGHADQLRTVDGLANSKHPERGQIGEHGEDVSHGSHPGWQEAHGESGACGKVRRLADMQQQRLEGHPGDGGNENQPGRLRLLPTGPASTGCTISYYSDFVVLPCRDGKARRTESSIFPLVARLPKGMVPSGDPSLSEVQATAEARTMRLKGYGNAIHPYLAAEFILASIEAIAQPYARPDVLGMDDPAF